jgi:hypothetical protein
MSYNQEVIQQQEHIHIIQEEISEHIVPWMIGGRPRVDGVDLRIREMAVAPLLTEEMVVVPRPSMSGGLHSMTLQIKGHDVGGVDAVPDRSRDRGWSPGGNRSDVGKNSVSNWHCWLVWLMGEGRGDERNEQPVEARLLSNPPSPFHQAIKTLGSSRHSIGAPRTTLRSSRLPLSSTRNDLGLLWNLFGLSG